MFQPFSDALVYKKNFKFIFNGEVFYAFRERLDNCCPDFFNKFNRNQDFNSLIQSDQEEKRDTFEYKDNDISKDAFSTFIDCINGKEIHISDQNSKELLILGIVFGYERLTKECQKYQESREEILKNEIKDIIQRLIKINQDTNQYFCEYYNEHYDGINLIVNKDLTEFERIIAKYFEIAIEEKEQIQRIPLDILIRIVFNYEFKPYKLKEEQKHLLTNLILFHLNEEGAAASMLMSRFEFSFFPNSDLEKLLKEREFISNALIVGRGDIEEVIKIRKIIIKQEEEKKDMIEKRIEMKKEIDIIKKMQEKTKKETGMMKEEIRIMKKEKKEMKEEIVILRKEIRKFSNNEKNLFSTINKGILTQNSSHLYPFFIFQTPFESHREEIDDSSKQYITLCDEDKKEWKFEFNENEKIKELKNRLIIILGKKDLKLKTTDGKAIPPGKQCVEFTSNKISVIGVSFGDEFHSQKSSQRPLKSATYYFQIEDSDEIKDLELNDNFTFAEINEEHFPEQNYTFYQSNSKGKSIKRDHKVSKYKATAQNKETPIKLVVTYNFLVYSKDEERTREFSKDYVSTTTLNDIIKIDPGTTSDQVKIKYQEEEIDTTLKISEISYIKDTKINIEVLPENVEFRLPNGATYCHRFSKNKKVGDMIKEIKNDNKDIDFDIGIFYGNQFNSKQLKKTDSIFENVDVKSTILSVKELDPKYFIKYKDRDPIKKRIPKLVTVGDFLKEYPPPDNRHKVVLMDKDQKNTFDEDKYLLDLPDKNICVVILDPTYIFIYNEEEYEIRVPDKIELDDLIILFKEKTKDKFESIIEERFEFRYKSKNIFLNKKKNFGVEIKEGEKITVIINDPTYSVSLYGKLVELQFPVDFTVSDVINRYENECKNEYGIDVLIDKEIISDLTQNLYENKLYNENIKIQKSGIRVCFTFGKDFEKYTKRFDFESKLSEIAQYIQIVNDEIVYSQKKREIKESVIEKIKFSYNGEKVTPSCSFKKIKYNQSKRDKMPIEMELLPPFFFFQTPTKSHRE